MVKCSKKQVSYESDFETGHLRSFKRKDVESSPLSQNPYSRFGLLHPWPSTWGLLSWNLSYFPSGQSVGQELLTRKVEDMFKKKDRKGVTAPSWPEFQKFKKKKIKQG